MLVGQSLAFKTPLVAQVQQRRPYGVAGRAVAPTWQPCPPQRWTGAARWSGRPARPAAGWAGGDTNAGDKTPPAPSNSGSSQPASSEEAAVSPTGASPPDPLVAAGSRRGSPSTLALLRASWALLRRHLVAVVLVFLAADCAAWLLQRAGHRALNAAALRLLPAPLSAEAAANPWFLSSSPQAAYQALTAVSFVLLLPLNILVRSWAVAAASLLCGLSGPGPEATQATGQPAAPAGPVGRWWAALPAGVEQVWGLRQQTTKVARRVFGVAWRVALRSLPLQAASLALVPLPWTLPRLAALQVALPVAALEGEAGEAALARARSGAGRLGRGVGLAWGGLLVAQRALEPAKAALLTAVPARWYRELPELPLALLAALVAASLAAHRLADLLPIAALQQARALEAGGPPDQGEPLSQPASSSEAAG